MRGMACAAPVSRGVGVIIVVVMHQHAVLGFRLYLCSFLQARARVGANKKKATEPEQSEL